MLKFNIFVFYLFLLGTTYFVNSLPKFSRSSDRVTNEELDELEKLLVEKLKREELRRPIKETELLDEEQNLNDKTEFQSLEKFLRKKDKYLREYGKERERVYESAGKRLDRQNMLQKFNVREEEVMDETKRYSVVDKNSQDTIDVSKVDPSSHLANELEGMEIEVNGKVHLVQGLHPENSQKAKANSMDKHLYTQDQLHNLLPNNKRGYKRNFDKTATLWEKGIVPYVMYNMSRWAIPVINTGIQQINNNTCVKWIEKDKVTEHLSHSNVVYIINEGGCWSYVGSVFTRQYLSLSEPGCISVSTAVHEMLHAMGGHHEQSRSDRDEYVTIDFSNVRGGTRNINMRKFNTYDNNPYDAESSMQYSLYAFSMNSQKTIFFKDQRLEFLANSADGLEFYDMADVTKAYNCTDHCSTKPNCQNGGFVNFRCECVCPNSLSGPLCETPVSKGNCGGIINIGLGETKYIESPNFSSGGNYPYGLNCTWLIKGVPGNRIRASVQSMDVTSSNVCNHWIEYRYNLLGQRGPRICGTNNVADSEIWDTTKDELQHVMIIKFNSESNIGAQGRGFQIKLNNIGTGCDNHRCMYGKCTSPEGTNTYTCICDSGMSGPYCDQFSPYAVITAGFEFGEKNIFGQVSTDQFDWSIRSGSTSSSDTGPNRAKEGFQYTYIETSSPRKEGDRATMETSGIFSDIERCMRFWYHMYGSHIGTLSVYTEGTGVSRAIQFNLKGDQGNSWNNAFFNIPSMPNLKVTIEATRGSGYKGDIAIDDVKFIPGSCDNPVTSGPITPQPTTQGTTTQPYTTQPTTTQLTTTQPMTTQPNTTQPTTTQRTTTQPTATKATTLQPTAGPVTDEVCDFETDAACFLVEDQNDDQDWTVRSGSTPSSGTGPSSAYEGNRYKYMEMSSPVQNGDVATLVSSNALHAGSSYCLTFAYHMHGSTSMGSLKVGTGSNSLTNSLLSMKGTQGDQWHNAVVDITGTAGHKLFISANRCTTWKGDIAIDDVRLTNQRCSNVIDPCDSSPCQNYGSCEVYGSDYVCRCPAGFSGKNCEAEDGADVTEFVCTFESGENCVFEDDVNDDFDWTPRSGPTPSGRTGPSSAYKGTQYIYMEASSPRAPGDTAVLSTRTTKLRTQYNYCLSFFYHMLVTNGILRVTAAERTDATQSELFSLSGNQGNQWIFAFVSIPNTYSDLVVSIEGIRQSSWMGDIAIDNIILFQGDCSGMICRYNPCMNGGTCTASGTSYTCSCATGYAGVNCTGQDTSNLDYMECTFETGTQCIFQDSTNDEFDWTKKSGGTPSRNTGPSGAGEGSKYMYIETSSPRVSGDTAVLTTENSRLASGYAYCLQFMYHMKITSGTLQVYAGDVTATNSLWERSGTQPDEDNWQTASVDIPASNNPVIEIVGTRGSSYRGDIAIDEIQLNRRQCPTRK